MIPSAAVGAAGYEDRGIDKAGESFLVIDADAKPKPETPVDPPLPSSEEGRQVLYSLNGLASIGSAAWPMVRTYLWESCFNGHDMFVGYAHSMPGNEDGEALTFQVMVDKDTWNATAALVRQELMHKVNELFADRLAELNLKGALAVVLITR